MELEQLEIQETVQLENLYQNYAIKFTNTGGVFITLEALHRGFIITIKDTGIGIPKESIEIIFEEFRQVSEGLGRGSRALVLV